MQVDEWLPKERRSRVIDPSAPLSPDEKVINHLGEKHPEVLDYLQRRFTIVQRFGKFKVLDRRQATGTGYALLEQADVIRDARIALELSTHDSLVEGEKAQADYESEAPARRLGLL